MDNPEVGVSIRLTPEQLAEILAQTPPIIKDMADLGKAVMNDPTNTAFELAQKARDQALADQFRAPMTYIRANLPNLTPEIWHSGGGIYLIRIELDYKDEPYLLIDESEVSQDGPRLWRVGAYYPDNDEAIGFEDEVDGYQLAPTIRKMISIIGDSPPPSSGVEQAAARLITAIYENQVLDKAGATYAMEYWDAFALTEPFGLVYYEEGDGLRSQSAAGGLSIIMLTNRQTDEQQFMVYWHDGMVNEWHQLFDSYSAAIDYFGDLLKACLGGKHVDEVRGPVLPPMLEHMTSEHGHAEAWPVRVWFNEPQVCDGEVRFDTDTNQTAFFPNYNTARGAGDASEDTDFICGICDADLSLTLDLDLNFNE